MLELKAGEQKTFVAIADEVEISDENAILLPFDNAPANVGASGGGDANNADLTAHTENAEIHVTAAERESWNEKQFTETEEAILKRGVERDFLTRSHTYVFITDENDLSHTLSDRPPMPDIEAEGNYTLYASLNKEVVKEWLGIGASISEPMSDKWIVMADTENYAENNSLGDDWASTDIAESTGRAFQSKRHPSSNLRADVVLVHTLDGSLSTASEVREYLRPGEIRLSISPLL